MTRIPLRDAIHCTNVQGSDYQNNRLLNVDRLLWRRILSPSLWRLASKRTHKHYCLHYLSDVNEECLIVLFNAVMQVKKAKYTKQRHFSLLSLIISRMEEVHC